MTTPEACEALSRGILDGSPVGPTLAHGWKSDEVAKCVIDGPGTEYPVTCSALVTRQADAVPAKWKTTGVEVIPFPRGEPMKAAASEAVAEVRAERIAKAARTGLPVQEIAGQRTLRRAPGASGPAGGTPSVAGISHERAAHS